MMQINIKRCLSLILAMVLTFSLLPVSALAEEVAETIAIETTSLTEATETPTEAPEKTTIPVTEETVPETTAPAVVVEETAPVVAAASSNKDTVQAAMDAIAAKYLDLTKVLTTEDAAQAVADMDDDTWFEALLEVENLENSNAVQALTEEELLELTEKNPMFCAFADAVYERAAIPDDAGLYTTVTVLDGKISVSDTANSNTESGGTVTIKASGSLFSKKTNNITITNTSGTIGQLSFDYSVTYANSFKIAGSDAAASGKYSVLLDPDAALSITLQSKSGLSNTIATLTLSNISLTEPASSSQVTIAFNSNIGSVTAAGSAVTSGETLEVSLADGVTLVAAPISGAAFLGWIDADGKIISTSASYTLKVASDMTIKAAFASGSANAWFFVDKTYLLDDLNLATEKGTTIVLQYSGTLPSGITYTIPKGDKLLIPYSDSDSGHFIAKPDNFISESEICAMYDESKSIHTRNFPFRTLTVPTSTKIICNGEINVNGQRQGDGQTYIGVSAGGYGKIVLNGSKEEEQLTIESGAKLYCYGYIIGSGMVTIKDGGTLYEYMQVGDWPGGSNATNWKKNAGKTSLFLLTQYYLQNIEAPLRMNYGGKAYAEARVNVSVIGGVSISEPYVGKTDGLFHMSEGAYVIRRYNPESDDMYYHIYGGSISIGSIEVTVAMGQSINSASYTLALGNNMSVIIEENASLTLDKRVAIMPGSSIKVNHKGYLNVTDGGGLYLVDVKDWTYAYFYQRASSSSHPIHEDYANLTWKNQKPNIYPVPYVATRDDVSPRIYKLMRVTYTNDGQTYQRYIADVKNTAKSGLLTVDGTLSVTGTGEICTTSNNASSNKAITGTGIINYQATPSEGALQGGYNATVRNFTTTYGLGTILGHGSLKPFGQYTYYGSSNGWYNWVVSADSAETRANIVLSSDTAASGETVSHNYHDPIANALGYVSFTQENTQSPFSFTLRKTPECEPVSATYATLSGTYSLAADQTGHPVISMKVEHTPVTDPAVAPTVGSEGKTEGSHCSVCNKVLVEQQTLPALVDGVIYGTNIRIGDTLDLHFYINRSVLDPLIQEGKTYKAVLTREYVNSEGNPDTSDKTYQQAEWEVYSSKYYRVSYDGFAAKEMTDDVHITIYEADTGYQVSETKTDSIRGYAVRSLKNTNNPDALRRTVIDMLNYGASAQEHFLYKTGDLANTGDSVIAENAQYASESASYALDSTNENSDSFYGLNISLKSDLYLNFYFYNVTEDMTADFSYIKHNNSKTSNEYPIPYNDFGSGKDENGVALKGVKVKGLGIADGRTDVTCTLSNGQTATASVEGYIAATIAAEKKLENPSETLIAVCENLMKFIDSANAYFK